MKKRRLKKNVYFSLIIISCLGISIISFIIYRNYVTSNKYLLLQLGYAPNEVVEYLKEPKLVDILLKHEYNKDIIAFIDEEYFIEDNLDSYLTYKKENLDKSNKDIVSIINTGANKDWYSGSVKTDLSKGNLMLVNKFNYLDETFVPKDLEEISVMYSFAGKEIRKEVNDAFVKMSKDAKKEGYTIVANSTFRDYEYQDTLYKEYVVKFGQEAADSFAAKPGYSEHQTGLSIDVSTLSSTMYNFDQTEEYTWLLDNAHEYGFILRYPDGLEYITGYGFESWHYRYVGVDVATEIKNKGITFDEYYAYYLR